MAEDLRKILNYILKTECSEKWLSKKGHGIQEKWPFCVFFQELLGFFLLFMIGLFTDLLNFKNGIHWLLTEHKISVELLQDIKEDSN